MKFVVDVPVRWSDMDAYGHVNHAQMVTLLEDARIELLFREMPRRGFGRITDGIVVYKLSVEYRSPLVYDDSPIRIEIWATAVRAASFVLRYAVYGRANPRVHAVAETTLVPYDLARTAARRLTADESKFLALWTPGEGTPGEGTPGEGTPGEGTAEDDAASA